MEVVFVVGFLMIVCFMFGYFIGHNKGFNECSEIYEKYSLTTSKGYNDAINDFKELVKQLIEELDVGECTKYGNKDSEQQAKSYDTLMKYEIADSIDDLLSRLEVLKD